MFSTAGHHLLVLAYGRAPASQVTPFLCFQLIFAALGGRLVAHRPIQVAAAARPAKA